MKYGPLVTTLGAQLDKVKWLDVEHALMDEQFRNHGKKTSSRDTALVGARGKPFGRPKKKNIKCYTCGKPGHFKYECPNRKADDGQKQGHSAIKTAKEEPEDMEVAFHAPAGKTEAGQKSTWLIDSGASCHMTWDLSIMYDYKAFEEPDAVSFGDGYSVEALGVGKVRVKMLIGSKVGIHVFHHVLYVPDLTTNLFSVEGAGEDAYWR